ncbi:MAG: lipocalin-like domain-containing protein [Chloroherpetonaceae bacterium]|nr:lipocalin-like domain-containing protein [Chloroherpetonaceae bacterium]
MADIEFSGKLSQNHLTGVWEILSYEVTALNGEKLYPYSLSPKGYLIYTKESIMAVQIMHPERPKHQTPGVENNDELKRLYNGYIAYFGRYAFDEKQQEVTHFVEGSLQTWIIDTNQKRAASFHINSFTDTRLILSAHLSSGRNTRFHEITWRRIREK